MAHILRTLVALAGISLACLPGMASAHHHRGHHHRRASLKAARLVVHRFDRAALDGRPKHARQYLAWNFRGACGSFIHTKRKQRLRHILCGIHHLRTVSVFGVRRIGHRRANAISVFVQTRRRRSTLQFGLSLRKPGWRITYIGPVPP